jgi:type IV pilus assembly protein PilA
MNLRSKAGFSLVELMIVVAIIGILAAIAVPNFQRFQAKSRQAEARADLAAIYTAQKAFNAEWGQYLPSFIETGYLPEGVYRYEHGFAATGGVNTPPNYAGRLGPGNNAVPAAEISTVACGAAPAVADFHPSATITANCSVIRPNAGVANGSITAAAFIATASANIDGDAAFDVWQMNQTKQVFGPCSVSAAAGCVANGGDLDN